MRYRKWIHSALLASVALPGMAYAQSTPAPSNPDEIVVTATRREQTLLDVPLSVAAVSGENIRQMGVQQFNDLQASVPNLQIDQTNGNFVVSMRGLGSGGGNLAFEQSVGFFNDGVYSGRSRSMQTAMMDVARIEVVRGPQGALFGKNTNAGAISVVTNRPTREFEMELRGRYEFENNGYGGGGYISGPLNDAFSARLSFQAGHEGGYMHNRATGRDDNSNNNLGVRGQLLFEPVTGGGSLLLKVEYGRNNYRGGNLVYNGLGPSSCRGCTLIRDTSAPYGGMPEVPSFERTQISAYPEFSRTRGLNVTLTGNLDLSDTFKLTTISAYQDLRASTRTDVDASPVSLIDSIHTENTRQMSQEVRFTGSVGPLDVIFGGSYFYANTNIEQVITWGANLIGIPAVGDVRLPFHQTSESLSPFAALDWHITDQLTLSGSVRYSHESKSARIEAIMPPVYILSTPYIYNLTRSESLWDYSGRLSYRPNSTMQFYVSYATGTKGGGFVSNDSRLGVTRKPEFEPERARSLEIGAKFRLIDGRLHLNMAAFRTNFSDLQVSSFTGTSFTTGNAARARSQGLEGDFTFRPIEFLTIGGSGAYLDAYYSSYPAAACIYGATAPQCVAGQMDLSGYRLTRAPKWKWNAYVQVDVPIATDWTLSARGSADHISQSIYQDDRAPGNIMPAYTRYDARLAVSSEANGLDIALVGRNLTNKVSWSQAFGIPLLQQSWGVFVNPARTIALEVTKRF